MDEDTVQTLSDFYLVVSSQQSLSICDYNTGCFFTVKLDDFIDFRDHDYEVALVDMSFCVEDAEMRQMWKPLFINLDIVEPTNVLGTLQRLLRYTCVKRGKFLMEKFDHPYYVPVSKIRTDEMTFSIKNVDTGLDATSLDNKTICTLHFRKKRSIWLTV